MVISNFRQFFRNRLIGWIGSPPFPLIENEWKWYCISFDQSIMNQNDHQKLCLVFWSFRSRSKQCAIEGIGGSKKVIANWDSTAVSMSKMTKNLLIGETPHCVCLLLVCSWWSLADCHEMCNPATKAQARQLANKIDCFGLGLSYLHPT